MTKASIFYILLGIFLLVVLIGGYFAYKSVVDETIRLRNEIVQSKKLTEDIFRASNKWATKDDLNTSLKKLVGVKDFNTIKDDLDKLDSKISAVGKTVGNVKSKIEKSKSSDKEIKHNQPTVKCDGKLIDIHKYTEKTQIKELKDSNSAPIGKVEFDASNKKPWSYEIYNKGYKLITVIGKKEGGQLTFHNKLQYSIPIKDANKFYPVNITSSDFLQARLNKRWFWINPKLDVNLAGGGIIYDFLNESKIGFIGMGIGLSLSSYGENKLDSWFRFFRIGVGYNAVEGSLYGSFSPVSFNIGRFLPILTNLYIDPQVGIDTSGGLILSLGIGPQI